MGRILKAGLISVAALIASPAAARDETAAEKRLEAVIERAIHADGPFLQPQERALIERKCGYAPGSWKGESFSMTNGVLTCDNGRRVDDPEIRAMMDVVGPRISRRVNAAMKRPEVTAAIDAVAREASAAALKELAEEGLPRSRRR